jgi:hypothetical protein
MRQYPEALHDYSKASRDAEEIVDDHIEALAAEPMESLEHCRRRSVHPSVVHIHRHEPVQKRTVFRLAAAGVLCHHIVRRVQMQAMLICYLASNGRFARAATAPDPVHMAQLFA